MSSAAGRKYVYFEICMSKPSKKTKNIEEHIQNHLIFINLMISDADNLWNKPQRPYTLAIISNRKFCVVRFSWQVDENMYLGTCIFRPRSKENEWGNYWTNCDNHELYNFRRTHTLKTALTSLYFAYIWTPILHVLGGWTKICPFWNMHVQHAAKMICFLSHAKPVALRSKADGNRKHMPSTFAVQMCCPRNKQTKNTNDIVKSEQHL